LTIELIDPITLGRDEQRLDFISKRCRVPIAFFSLNHRLEIDETFAVSFTKSSDQRVRTSPPCDDPIKTLGRGLDGASPRLLGVRVQMRSSGRASTQD
jgi:hypothetical protein